jgi:hypothetical protein
MVVFESSDPTSPPVAVNLVVAYLALHALIGLLAAFNQMVTMKVVKRISNRGSSDAFDEVGRELEAEAEKLLRPTDTPETSTDGAPVDPE